MSINITFLPDDITIKAEPGESLLNVAERAGVYIPTGCLMGSCYACEVENDLGDSICACISSVPADRDRLTIYLYDTPNW